SELAILLRRNRFTQLGTLARVPLAGGVPREVASDVLNADWSGDGASLAVIRSVSGKYRVEFPIGSVRHQTTRPIRDVRVSPDGTKLAFIELINGENFINVIDKGDAAPIAHGWPRGATGLAWSPDGAEIWITGTSTSAPPALYAIPLEGDTRMISRLTGSMKLFDISRAGRALLSNGVWRAALMWKPSAEAPEHDMSWLDWSVLADLSSDGGTILFNEPREGGGPKGGMYLRRLGEPVPVRIGDGLGDAISPDGKWVLGHTGSKLQILPTGTGEARELKIEGNFDQGAVWLPDSKRVVVGNASGQLTLVDTLDEKTMPLSPNGIWNAGIRAFALSPDARFVAGMNADETIVLYPIDGSLTAVAVPGVEKGEIPIQFSADGAALYVYRPNALPANVQRVELATGARTLWREFSPADPAGVYKISPVLVTPDGNAYAYDALRTLSDLYVAEGLK
ncbi:MAG TPA: WD40 repeat domain-containing protein, partial [Thermoanaerobaculia bacterium]|nr:WD40 repeat domain-containing protein [Thermoanaerobaculia bacterium]